MAPSRRIWVGVPDANSGAALAAARRFGHRTAPRGVAARKPDGRCFAVADIAAVSEIRNVASGRIFSEPSPEIVMAAERYAAWSMIARWAMVVVALCAMALALFLARTRMAPQFRARQAFERNADHHDGLFPRHGCHSRDARHRGVADLRIAALLLHRCRQRSSFSA